MKRLICLVLVAVGHTYDASLDTFEDGKLTLTYREADMERYGKIGVTNEEISKQWYLTNSVGIGGDLNVTGVWEMGYTGRGVTVAVVDDGLEIGHGSFAGQYSSESSYNFVDSNHQVSPVESDKHGTNCAGLIAAKVNGTCGVGIAYNAKLSSIKIFSEKRNAGYEGEAVALTYKNQINDIYSCSWGPNDDGTEAGVLGSSIQHSLRAGALQGRQGKGSIFVFPAGNGGAEGDYCSFNGYANSIYTIAVGAIDHHDRHPAYSETCTALIISTYSSMKDHNTLFTTTTNNECTWNFGKTSAATAATSGVLALVLEARPELTWRDIQHLLIRSAKPPILHHPSWSLTYANRNYSTYFGYGRIDAYSLVKLAQSSSLVRPQTNLTSGEILLNQAFLNRYSTSFRLTQASLQAKHLHLLEHVAVTINISHPQRGKLEISLTSPNNIVSPLILPRAKDNSTMGFKGIKVMSLKHWDEPALGTWRLSIIDHSHTLGSIHSWEIHFFGQLSPNQPIAVNNLPQTIIQLPEGPKPQPPQELPRPPKSKIISIPLISPTGTTPKEIPTGTTPGSTTGTPMGTPISPTGISMSPHPPQETFLETEKRNLVLVISVTLVASTLLAIIVVIIYARPRSSYVKL